jgi:hypothetical protein
VLLDYQARIGFPGYIVSSCWDSKVPENVKIIPLPAYSPELNQVENL